MFYLFPEGSIYHSGAQADPDVSGTWSIYAHMSPRFMQDDRTPQSKLLNADAVAEMLKGQGWKPGEPVDFIGCRSGQGDNSIAEQFHKKYGSSTRGATEFMWFNYDGIKGIYNKVPFLGWKNRFASGYMREFHAPPRPLPPRSKRSP